MAELPSEDEVWERVRRYAQRCMRRGTEIRTLKYEVRNTIVRVTDRAIHRQSERTTSKDPPPITRAQVRDAWHHVVTGEKRGDPMAFTYALLLGAMGDLIVKGSSGLRLRSGAKGR